MFKDTFDGYDGLNRSLEMIRANPVPFALIGIATGWLIASNTNALARVADLASDIGMRAGELASDVAATVGLGESPGSAAERPLGHTGNPLVDERMDEAGRSGSDGWVHQASDMAQDALRSARDSGGAMLNRAGSYAGDGASRIADQLSGAFERHPLAVGAVGIVAGALLATLVPATRAEGKLFGSTRDDLLHKAREAGQQAVARVREIGARAAARAADAAAQSGNGEIGEGQPAKPSQG
jgi:hypothetical protein